MKPSTLPLLAGIPDSIHWHIETGVRAQNASPGQVDRWMAETQTETLLLADVVTILRHAGYGDPVEGAA